jgi:hypothetical protein
MIASTVILSCAFTLRNLAISAFYSLVAPALPPTSTLARRTKLPNVPSPIPSESATSTIVRSSSITHRYCVSLELIGERPP